MNRCFFLLGLFFCFPLILVLTSWPLSWCLAPFLAPILAPILASGSFLSPFRGSYPGFMPPFLAPILLPGPSPSFLAPILDSGFFLAQQSCSDAAAILQQRGQLGERRYVESPRPPGPQKF